MREIPTPGAAAIEAAAEWPTASAFGIPQPHRLWLLHRTRRAFGLPPQLLLSMNPLRFTRLRWRIFLSCLGVIFLTPLCMLLGSRIPIAGAVLTGAAFFVYLLLVNIPGLIFREPLFTFQEFGAIPQGLPGWATVIGFWIVAAFFLSWPANLKRDE